MRVYLRVVRHRYGIKHPDDVAYMKRLEDLGFQFAMHETHASVIDNDQPCVMEVHTLEELESFVETWEYVVLYRHRRFPAYLTLEIYNGDRE